MLLKIATDNDKPVFLYVKSERKLDIKLFSNLYPGICGLEYTDPPTGKSINIVSIFIKR